MPDAPGLTVEQAYDLLKDCGLRRTFARLHVLQCLSLLPGPASHAEIAARLAAAGVDDSTIFRTLSSLVEAGAVARLDLGDRMWRYELVGRSLDRLEPSPRHPHAVCRVCNRIECLPASGIPPVDEHLSHWRVEEILFKGVCRDCRPTSDADGSRRI